MGRMHDQVWHSSIVGLHYLTIGMLRSVRSNMTA